MDSSKTKEVLIVYNNRRRAVRFHTDVSDPCAEHKRLYDAAEEAFKDVFLLGEGSSSSHGTAFYLEFESEEWGKQMVDVSGSVTVPTKAIVYLRRVPQTSDRVRENLNDVRKLVHSCKSIAIAIRLLYS